MKKVEITVNGKAYPCRVTMGAMLRFKRETGREVVGMTEWSFSDLCVFLWCCVASASKHEGIDFDMELMDFADSLSPEDLNGWAETLNGEPLSRQGDSCAIGAGEQFGGEKKSGA